MKRILCLTTLSLMATLVAAPASLAQGVTPTGETDPYGCPEDAPFVATAPGDPGETSLRCFATQAEANEYSETGEVAEKPQNPEEVPCSEILTTVQGQPNSATLAQEQRFGTERVQDCLEQIAGQYQTEPSATLEEPVMEGPLPDTGGPALLLPAAGLLFIIGLIVYSRLLALSDRR